MTALAGYAGLHPNQAPARRLRELVSPDDTAAPGGAASLVVGDGWAIAAVGSARLPGDDGPVRVTGPDGDRGLLVGRLYGRGSPPMRRLREPVPLEWLTPDSELARRRWGRYAAAAVRPDGTLVLARDPIGALPCFHAAVGTGYVFASRVDVLVELLGERPEFDWDRLGSFLVQGPCPTSRTAFRGVGQLPPGVVARFTAGQAPRRAPLWDPVRLAADPDQPPHPDELRETLLACTSAWLAETPVAALDLSGGLDSSTVCWAARAGGPAGQRLDARFVHFGAGPSMNERPLAERVARHLDTPLRVVAADDMLPLTPPDGPLPRADAPQLQFTEARLNQTLARQDLMYIEEKPSFN